MSVALLQEGNGTAQLPGAWILAPNCLLLSPGSPALSCVILGQLLDLSLNQLSRADNNSILLIELLGVLNDLLYVESIKQCPAHLQISRVIQYVYT